MIFLTFFAIKLILAVNSFDQLNFSRLMMVTLPDANKQLVKHSELITDPLERIGLDIQDVTYLKLRAAACYGTQSHLMEFFQRSGILSFPTEYYLERIRKDGDNVEFDRMPRDKTDYISSNGELFEQIEARCNDVLETVKIF